jgi:hypothetical protein
MRRSRILSLVVCLCVAVTAVGCKTGSSQKDDKSLTEEKRPVPDFFSEIPADTFYVYTGLQPFPEDVVRATLEESGEAAPYGEMLDNVTAGAGETPDVIEAIAEELDGNMSVEGLRDLGFALEANFAFYGLGPIPVFRLQLGDVKAFREMLERVEKRAGTSVDRRKHGGQTYRVYRNDDLAVPLVIRDGEVIVSALDHDLLETVVPYLVGAKKPDRSLAGMGNLRQMTEQYGYERHGLGYVDIAGAVRSFAGIREPDPVTAAVMEWNEVSRDEYSEVCREELDELVASAPRAVFGFQEFSAQSVQVHGGLELDSELANQLAGTVTPLPGLRTDTFDEAAVSFGFGLDVDKLTQVLNQHASSMVEQPYKCDSLEPLNRWAQRFERRPIPTFVRQLRGATLMLEGLEFGSGQYVPSDIEAIGLIRSSNPQGLLGQLQMFVPGLAQASVSADGVPVALQQLGRQVGFFNSPHIAMTDELIAMSTGVGMQDEMAVLLEEGQSNAATAAVALGWNLEKIRASLPGRAKGLLTQMFGESYAEAMQGSRTTQIQLTGSGVFFETRSEQGVSETSERADGESSGAPEGEE